MRLFPILAAIVVSALVYAFVFERDALRPRPAEVTQTPPRTGAATSDTPKEISVVAVRSTAQPIGSAVVLRGQTEAFRQVELRSETTGQVISDPLRRGAFVEKGQLLCRLDPGTREATLAEKRAMLLEARSRIPEAEARLQEAESRLSEARINDNAAKKLSQGGFASETRVASTQAAVSAAQAAVQAAKSGVDGSQSGIQSAEAAVAAARWEIERLSITAPFAGLLESDTAELGSLMQPGSLCATIIQLNPMILVGFVPEADVNRIELGARAGAQLTSGEEVTGSVTFLSRAADPETRTFRVEIQVANDALSLRDGQTANIVIDADGTQAHLLPQSALTLNDEGTMGVRTVSEEGTAMFVAVTLLRDTPQGVWLAGLPEQADVILIGQEYVTDGVRVAASFQESRQ